MMVWVARCTTESADHYVFVFVNQPYPEDAIEKIWEQESNDPNEYDWYLETTSVFITEEELIEN